MTLFYPLSILLLSAGFVAGNAPRLGQALSSNSHHKLIAHNRHNLVYHSGRSSQFDDQTSGRKRKRDSPRCRAPSAAGETTIIGGNSPSTTAASATTVSEAIVGPLPSSSSVQSSTHAPSASQISPPLSGHVFSLTNRCSYTVTPRIADTKCGYSPRCSDASSFSGSQPPSISSGQTQTVIIDNDWVGRIFNQNGKCGPKGEDCTMLEFNLDTGSFYTPQAYDISNIQGFTQPISIGAQGCATSTCSDANCGCQNAYPVGDLTGCDSDIPVKACGVGAIAFDVVFCP